MTDPKIITLSDPEFADLDLDPHVLQDAVDDGAKRVEKIPLRYQEAVAEHPQVRDWVASLVRGAAKTRSGVPNVSTGPSIHLMGTTGSGKTFAAYGALRALSMSGALVRWRFVTAADFLGKMRPNQKVSSEDVLADFCRASVLVLDDLGAEKGSEWAAECLYRLIDTRYVEMLPTLITSNMDPTLLGEALGDRIKSRLREMCTRIVYDGNDRRRPPK